MAECKDCIHFEVCAYIKHDLPVCDSFIASVVPVVRCRECRRWDVDPDSYSKDDGPKGKCMKSFEETYEDDFCSYGQRKEADHDQVSRASPWL